MRRWWGFVSLAVGALVVSSCGYQGPSATPPPDSTTAESGPLDTEVPAEPVADGPPAETVDVSTVPPTTVPFGSRAATSITYDSEGRVRSAARTVHTGSAAPSSTTVAGPRSEPARSAVLGPV